MEALRLQTSADQGDPKPSTPKNFLAPFLADAGFAFSSGYGIFYLG